MSEGIVRLEATPVTTEALAWGDEVRVHEEPDGSLSVQEVVARAPFAHFLLAVQPGFAESAQFAALKDDLVKLDGVWELLYGGVLVLHVPEAHAKEGSDLAQYAIAFAEVREPALVRARRMLGLD